MKIEGTLPPGFVEPLARALAERGVVDTRVVGRSAGAQGTCFVLEVRPGNEKLVLKTMSPARPSNTREAAEREYRALEVFHETTRGYSWVSAPEPLVLFKEQLGYLMRYVDAPNLHDLLEAGSLRGGDTRVIAGRIVDALELYHRSVGVMYGDCHPANILVRPSLQIVLIDPTPTSPHQLSFGDSVRYSPMSADIGYWAYSVATRSVKQTLKGSKLPARLYELTSEVIAHAGRSCPDNDIVAFSDAVYEVAGRYMLRLKTHGGLKVRVLGPLAESRLRALRARSRVTAAKHRSAVEVSPVRA